MRVAIVGSRNWPNPAKVQALVREIVAGLDPDDVVVSGGAQGIDTWAANAARLRGLKVDVYRVTSEEWRIHGKRAGMLRNSRIRDNCDRAIAVWDGTSSGTGNMIGQMRAAGKPVEIRTP